ncbi:hypothetical protein [Acidimangrovimonas pyrenivorans]|uniref:DUF2125 domain-containing protein n=1 Tax=Acidimangrovimonas pyrenivorans TaxID=2030798 RepID=A0ABV7AML2_9RHOB
MLATVPAFAGTATEAESRHIEAALQTYLGKAPGTVSVTPDGDSYHLHLDLSRALATLPEPVSVTIAPIDVELADQGNGLWGVDMPAQPIDIKLSLKGRLAQEMHIASATQTGVFDANLMAMTHAVADMKKLSGVQRTFLDGKESTKTAHQVAELHAETVVTQGASGLDIRFTETGHDFREQVASGPATGPDAASGQGAEPLDITADRFSETVVGTGMRQAEISALVRWLVAHPSKAEIKAGRAELLTKVSALLPVFDHLQLSVGLDDFTTKTPQGPVSLDKVGVKVGMNGIVPDGRLSAAVTAEGLHPPEGLLPDWASSLLPKTLRVDATVTGYNLEKLAKLAIDAAKADAKDPGDAAFTKAIFPSGTLTLSTKSSGVTGAGYSLAMAGDMQVGLANAAPTITGLINATGYANVLDKLNAAPDAVKRQIVPAMMMARGLARPDADGGLEWKLETSSAGHLLINGQDMGALNAK